MADFARYVYALDFLYFKMPQHTGKRANCSGKRITQAMAYIERRFTAAGESVLVTDPDASIIEALRQILFAVNLLEDIRQDVAVNLDLAVPKAATIFDAMPDSTRAVAYIKSVFATP